MPTIRSVVYGTTLAVMLTGHNPYTQYICYVTASTSVGEGSPSTIVTVQTAQSGNNVFSYNRSLYLAVTLKLFRLYKGYRLVMNTRYMFYF